MSKIRELISRQEGLRLVAYKCPRGRTTIGYGRNLDDLGISIAEAEQMLSNDLMRISWEAGLFPWFAGLDEVRQDAVLCMLFQLGLKTFHAFKRFHRAMELGRYDEASAEIIDSVWSKQTPARAREIASMISTGEYPG